MPAGSLARSLNGFHNLAYTTLAAMPARSLHDLENIIARPGCRSTCWADRRLHRGVALMPLAPVEPV
jgi:hypothetical protein